MKIARYAKIEVSHGRRSISIVTADLPGDAALAMSHGYHRITMREYDTLWAQSGRPAYPWDWQEGPASILREHQGAS